MNKSQKIYFNTEETGTNKHMKIKLEQNVQTLEFLTMSLSTEEVYQNFNADYGVLIGRVIANDSIGIPNAKVSIFIPLNDVDAENSEIYSVYPYKTPRDKNNEGKRYNLLPRVGEKNSSGVVSPKQPFGSFPIKEEIVTNEPFLNVYKKYYKYTTLTNTNGDYMIFGVPIGTQVVHMSVDITDIGEYSMNAASMVTNLGYSPNLFTDNNSRIKPSNDLNDLPNIETQEISADIIPFWGDAENFEIGITRQDFRIRATLKNTFIIFGSVFTDGNLAMWGNDYNDEEKIRDLYNMMDNEQFNSIDNAAIKTKRIGKVTEKIYYYPEEVSDIEIAVDQWGYGTNLDKVRLLDPTEYSVYKKNGDFVFIINCNRDKVIIDAAGNKIPATESTIGGIYTKFKGFITLEIEDNELPMDWTVNNNHVVMKPLRERFKFPQHAPKGHGFRLEDNDGAITDTNYWRAEHFTFTGGGIYSVARFHGCVWNFTSDNDDVNSRTVYNYSKADNINVANINGNVWNVGTIQTNDWESSGNLDYEMVENITTVDGKRKLFGANWLNLSIYLPQIAHVIGGYSYIKDWRTNTQFTQNFKEPYYTGDNTQSIVDNYLNTKFFARSDLNWTDIIHVPKEDILNIYQRKTKGFTNLDVPNLKGNYRNGQRIPAGTNTSNGWTEACPFQSPDGGNNEVPKQSLSDSKYYFYKGFGAADCIEFIMSLGLV